MKEIDILGTLMKSEFEDKFIETTELHELSIDIIDIESNKDNKIKKKEETT